MKKILRNGRRSLLKTGTLFSVLAFFSLSAWAQETGDNRPYTVQPGDVLEVSVWKEPELTREVLVRPDGGLSFPLAGEIAADGKSIEDVRDAITDKLDRYISDPVVTVSAKEIRGNKIYVLGEVRTPGEFIATRRIDVMQALSMAGGTTEYASRDDIIILRRDAGSNEQVALDFPYSDVSAGRNLEQNIVLRAGDVVVVP